MSKVSNWWFRNGSMVIGTAMLSAGFVAWVGLMWVLFPVMTTQPALVGLVMLIGTIVIALIISRATLIVIFGGLFVGQWLIGLIARKGGRSGT